MSRSFHRPENALKRANEFIDVEKPGRALEVLYEVIKRGKTRTNYSEKLLEPIMIKYLELCVDLKKSHLAKEGLFQYRNIFQSVNVSSLETVVRHYLQLAEERTEEARKQSHQAVVDIDDLDNLATPEEILLSAVSGEDAQDRSDRTILTPWVKFLWESYRQCLDLLRTNPRVERLYHDIAKQAFKFCEKYTRKTEFRKLCDNLRNHLNQIQKQQGSATAVNLSNPETQQMNLETRLEQLNYAIKMELWQEAYKAIEDISDLMTKSKKMPKPHVMASYYQKLSLVFWKAGNKLFHAAALYKLFQLLRDQKKNITLEEVEKRASIVLVATLAIPLPSAHPEFDRFIGTEKSAIEKVEKLATLLSLPKPPTRVSLIKEMVRMNVVSVVPKELQNLYGLMEKEFDPLNLCTRMKEHLKWINDHPDAALVQYVPDLEEMTITRLVKQVGQVYQTITFKRLLELAIFVSPFELERILVDLVRHNDLQIRIDHRERCVHFGADLSESQREDLPEGPTLQALPSETIRCQLVQMSSALMTCVAIIKPDAKKKEMEPVRATTITNYQQTKGREHSKVLQRQQIIEQRKEMLENQNLKREESIRREQEEHLKKQKEEEQARLKREALKREQQRQEEQMKQIQTKSIKDKLQQISQTSYGQKMIEKFDEEELLSLDAEQILQKQVEELEKERKELQNRLKAQEKKIDYTERAKRLAEIPLIKEIYAKKKEKDKESWEAQEKERIKSLVEDHRISLEHSKRLKLMHGDRDVFLANLKADRSEVEKKIQDFNARLEVQKMKRLNERKERRRKERLVAYQKEKAEAMQRQLDEKMEKDREENEKREREKREREEELFNRRKEMEEKRHRDDDEGKSDKWRPNTTGKWRELERANMEETWKPSNRRDDDSTTTRDIRSQDSEDSSWRRQEDKGDGERKFGPPRDIRRDEDFNRVTRDNDRGDNWRSDGSRGGPRGGRDWGRDDRRGGGDRDRGYRDGRSNYSRGDRDFPSRGGDRDFPSRGGDRDFPPRGGDRGDIPPRGGDREFPSRGGERDFPARGGDRDPPPRGDRDYPPRGGERDFPPRDNERTEREAPAKPVEKDTQPWGGDKEERESAWTDVRDKIPWAEVKEKTPWSGEREAPTRAPEREAPPRDIPPRGGERDVPPPRERDVPPPRERDIPPRERDIPPRERDIPPRERDIPPRERDIPPRGGDRDIPQRGEKAWGRDRDHPPRGGDREFSRGDRDFRGGDREYSSRGGRDFRRGGDRDRDGDFDRDHPRGDRDFQSRGDRGFGSRGGDRDRDFQSRGGDRDRDFQSRGGGRDRDFRDSRGSGRGGFNRDDRRDDTRGYNRDKDDRRPPPSRGGDDGGGGGGGSWRRGDGGGGGPPKEEWRGGSGGGGGGSSWRSGSKRTSSPGPDAEPEADSWTVVKRK